MSVENWKTTLIHQKRQSALEGETFGASKTSVIQQWVWTLEVTSTKHWCIGSKMSSCQSSREQQSQWSRSAGGCAGRLPSLLGWQLEGSWQHALTTHCLRVFLAERLWGYLLVPGLAPGCAICFVQILRSFPPWTITCCWLCVVFLLHKELHLVTEPKRSVNSYRMLRVLNLACFVFTWWNVWTHWKPQEDSAMVWGFPQWGALVTCHIGKTQHVPERELTPVLAEDGTKGYGYVPCTMPLVTHKCECGVPVSITDTPGLRLLYHLVISLFHVSDREALWKVILPYVNIQTRWALLI